MKIRTNRIAPLALATALAFGVVACEADDEPDTTVIEEDEGTTDGGTDTTIEEGDETTIEGGATEGDAATDTATSTESEG